MYKILIWFFTDIVLQATIKAAKNKFSNMTEEEREEMINKTITKIEKTINKVKSTDSHRPRINKIRLWAIRIQARIWKKINT